MSYNPIYCVNLMDYVQDDWDYNVDNEFAQNFFSRMPRAYAALSINSSELYDKPRLCDECNRVDVRDSALRVAYPVSYLAEHANRCDLCALFYGVASDLGLPMGFTIQFVRNKSILTNDVDGSPVLSLVSPPGKTQFSLRSGLI